MDLPGAAHQFLSALPGCLSAATAGLALPRTHAGLATTIPYLGDGFAASLSRAAPAILKAESTL